MNLLIISHNPERASFRQRIGIYVDLLCKAGIDCRIEKLPCEYIARWRLFKKAGEFDGVFLHKKCLNIFDSKILRQHAHKLIYDFDDAVMYSPQNPKNDHSSHFRLFRRTVTIADAVIAGNSYLAEHACQFNNNVNILPTGLDTTKYDIEIKKPNDNKVRLVWIGSKSTSKYLAEIKPVLEKIGSVLGQVVLRVICDEFLHFRKLSVENHRWSEQTEVIDLKQCDIGLAPLPDNRFTQGKCGFKILQYFAAGLPVVVSDVGVQKEFAADGRGLISSDENQWFENLVSLIKKSEIRIKMRETSKLWIKQYDTIGLGERLCAIIKNAMNHK